MRLIFILFILITSLFSETQMGLRGGGCTLSQKGDVSFFYNSKTYKSINYKANAKSGKNFREIFVGFIFTATKDLKLKILDYKPNKRIKGKPKSGIFIVEVTDKNVATQIKMVYIFDKGIISAIGIINNTTIGFFTEVNYSLCFVGKK